MQKVSDDYATQPLTVEPGNRLHRIVALLFDSYFDDVTDDRIAELEKQIESWRWCDAAGQRVVFKRIDDA